MEISSRLVAVGPVGTRVGSWTTGLRWASAVQSLTLLAKQSVKTSNVVAALPVGLHTELVSRHVLQCLRALAQLLLELLALL